MLPPPERERFEIFEYPPPPPPEPAKSGFALCPPPPPPIVSMLLLAEFQSSGTVHEVPEIINI
jgi:hypothetical protein